MDEPKLRSFARAAAEQRATFLSYRDAIEKLAVETGDTLNEIAAGLLAADIHRKHSAYLSGIETSVREREFERCFE